MKDLKFKGDGPGQSDRVRIGGELYRRGESYRVSDELAKTLIRKGGFVEQKPKKENEE